MESTKQFMRRLGQEVDILEIFFEALSTTKNNLTKDYLSD